MPPGARLDLGLIRTSKEACPGVLVNCDERSEFASEGLGFRGFEG